MKKHNIVVVDNGAATIKLGVAQGKAKVTPRFVRRISTAESRVNLFSIGLYRTL